MQIRNVIILVIIIAALSAAITKYYFPNVEMKTQEVTKEVIRNDIRTIVKEITRPDGSKEVVTETTDKTVKREQSQKEITINAKKNWLVSLTYNKSANSDGYQLSISRRQLGPLYLTGNVGTFGKEIVGGIGIGMEF